MPEVERERGLDLWTQAALALGLLLLALLACDIWIWHPGYAYGDETSPIAQAQRLREGAPWDFSRGFLYRTALWACMSLFPGQLWAPSLPALLAFALEGALLFALGRRLGGSRAGFFALAAGLCSAFSLVRGRSALAYALFPAELLFAVWLRLRCARPWQWLAWGALLGLLATEYEAAALCAALLLLLPFPWKLSWRQRVWELGGLALVLLATLDMAGVRHYLDARKNASLLQAGSPSAGLDGLLGLVFGGRTMPYLAPLEHGVLPPWLWFCLPFGLGAWRRELWVPLAYLGLGLALPLMGGAPYGLPAHRAVAAWPVLALLLGLGLDKMASWAARSRAQWLLAAALLLAGGGELRAWQRSQHLMDAPMRGPIRDLWRAAQAGWQESRRQGLPLVTETHPTQGAQFRFLTGHTVPMPDAKAATVLAFVQWEYLPALRGSYGDVATFQETGGYPPAFVARLRGALGQKALEAERELRPVFTQKKQVSVEGLELVLLWLRQHPKAGPWARTLAVHELMEAGVYLGRLEQAWVDDARREPLLSAHPLQIAAESQEREHPEEALAIARQARRLDPYNGVVWEQERRVLAKLGRTKELEALLKLWRPLDEKGLLYTP